jgi:hypothetical protein
MEPSSEQTKNDVSTDVTKTELSTNNITKTDTSKSRKSYGAKKLNGVQYFRKLPTLTGFENHDVTKERRPQWSFGVKSDGENHIDNKQFVFPRGTRRASLSNMRNKNKSKNICFNNQPKQILVRCFSEKFF